MKLKASDADVIIKQVKDQVTANCVVLATLHNLPANTTDDAVQGKLIDEKFLPDELVRGQGRAYAIGDLYKP